MFLSLIVLTSSSSLFAFFRLFNYRVDYLAGNGPVSVVASDFDGDGNVDLAVADADSTSSDVSIFLNHGDGTFSLAAYYSTESWTLSVCGADLDGDGDNDLATANYGAPSVSILLNNGDGTFAPPVNYGVGISPYSLCCADFDLDRDIDIATVNSGSDDISILLNRSNSPSGLRRFPWKRSNNDFSLVFFLTLHFPLSELTSVYLKEKKLKSRFLIFLGVI